MGHDSRLWLAPHVNLQNRSMVAFTFELRALICGPQITPYAKMSDKEVAWEQFAILRSEHFEKWS